MKYMPFNQKKLSKESKYTRLLGAFIRTHRKTENMSINFMADIIKISKPYLSELEHGKHIPKPYTLKQITKVLDVPFFDDTSTLDHLQKKLYRLFQYYAEMNKKEEYTLYQEIIADTTYEYSYSFLLYYLIKFMGSIRFQKELEQEGYYKDILLENVDLLSKDDKSILYDLLAVKCIKEKKYQKAQTYLTKGIEEESSITSPMMYYHMCVVYQELDEASEALLCCIKAEELFHQQYAFNRILYLLMYKGNCLTHLGAISTAKSFYLTALEKCSFYNNFSLKSTILDNLAWNALKSKDYTGCIYYSDKAIEAGSTFHDIFLYKPISLYYLNNYKDCRSAIEKAIGFYEEKTFNHTILSALSCLLKENFNNATMHLEAALEYHPDCENYIFILQMLCNIQEQQLDFKKLSYYQKEIITMSKRIY